MQLARNKMLRLTVVPLCLQAFGLGGGLLALPRSASADPPAPAPLPRVSTDAAGSTAQGPRRTLSLKDALGLAASQGPDVTAARAQAAIAAGNVQRAWAAWKPELTLTGQYVYTNAPQQLDVRNFLLGVGPLYGIQPTAEGMSQLPAPAIIVAERSQYGAVQVSQPLLSPQGLFLIAPANAGMEAASFGALEAREQVLLNVARTYLGLQGVGQLLDAAREAEKVALSRERDARNQLQVGTGVEVALLRAQADTAQARAQLAQLEGQRMQLLALLEALVGEAVEPSPTLATEALFGDAAPEEAAPWEQTFVVKSALKQVEVADGFKRFDQFSWLPTVAAVAKGNYNSNSGFSGKNTTADIALAVTLPLYDRGQRYASQQENAARFAQAQASLKATRARARAAWIAARANVEAARAALAQAEAQAELAARAQRVVEASARAGVSSSLELQDADSRRFQAASAAAQVRSSLEVRRAELAAAEGRLSHLVEP
ncbi:MAG: TolC family protein [Myxococcaceae bacterium]|nr:TolC family protein [Myxococcaceae bacterium]MCI0670688.1 TolC family protein [Myxococcaceae bacterium]